MSQYWRDCWNSLGERFGETGTALQKRMLDIARVVPPDVADSAMRAVWDAISLEYYANNKGVQQ